MVVTALLGGLVSLRRGYEVETVPWLNGTGHMHYTFFYCADFATMDWCFAILTCLELHLDKIRL
jgi:hypothetical protein